MITYKGTDRRGTARTGKTDRTPAALVHSCLRREWRTLVVERDGEEVGRIGQVYGGTTKTWYALQDVPR